MKIKKAFSLADILITITVVAIIAGVSLGFFKQMEPDKRIYDSTVRQLSGVVRAVNYKACSDDWVCWNGNIISSPKCPDYSADHVPFINNGCTHATDNDDTCNNGQGVYNLSNGQCVANPECEVVVPPERALELKRYNDVFCTNNVSDLSIRVKYTVGANTFQSSFFCYQAFDLLQNMDKKTSKETVCESTAAITLPNRARLYGLGTMSPATPAILLIKYDSINNPLFSNSDIASVSDSTTGYVVVYPNGTMTDKEKIMAAPGANPDNLNVNAIKCGFVPKGSKLPDTCPQADATAALAKAKTDINIICGADGANCYTATTNSISIEDDKAEKQNGTDTEPEPPVDTEPEPPVDTEPEPPVDPE